MVDNGVHYGISSERDQHEHATVVSRSVGRRGLATVGFSGAGEIGYGVLVEPRSLEPNRVEVPIRDLPRSVDGYAILQLSDLHRGPDVTQKDISRAVNLELQQETNLVVLTSYFMSEPALYASSCAAALPPLECAGFVAACLANHDHWTDAEYVHRALSHAGIAVLRNAAL